MGKLDYVLPTRKAIRGMVKDYVLLSFTDMAQSMVDAHNDSKVVTYGSDDTIKAAGNRKFDMKTAHITITFESKERESFSSGFYPNVLHSGEASAKTVMHGISKMARYNI